MRRPLQKSTSNSQLNAFNLADDLIEPYRPFVDLASCQCIHSNVRLSKAERKEIAHVLHNACIINDSRQNLMAAVDLTVESLKRIILERSDESLRLPLILPVESMEGITE